jgi:hypothetical protein
MRALLTAFLFLFSFLPTAQADAEPVPSSPAVAPADQPPPDPLAELRQQLAALRAKLEDMQRTAAKAKFNWAQCLVEQAQEMVAGGERKEEKK